MAIEPALIGAAAGLLTAGLAAAGFWMALGGRISKAETVSDTALRAAADAENAAKEAHVSIAALQAQLGMYREQTIREFVLHETLTEVEQRLEASQEKSEERITAMMNGMNKRLDRLIEVGLGRSGSSDT